MPSSLLAHSTGQSLSRDVAVALATAIAVNEAWTQSHRPSGLTLSHSILWPKREAAWKANKPSKRPWMRKQPQMRQQMKDQLHSKRVKCPLTNSLKSLKPQKPMQMLSSPNLHFSISRQTTLNARRVKTAKALQVKVMNLLRRAKLSPLKHGQCLTSATVSTVSSLVALKSSHPSPIWAFQPSAEVHLKRRNLQS